MARRRWVTKLAPYKLPPYKATCDICGKKAVFSFRTVKSARVRGACRKHLRKVR